ncbi:MAG: YbbR-like domain-containing protein [Deltaproteobacteria bacterium]|nr:YbbR-like domain-containing protein [Deltaproteobacteria bacterium]
MKILTTENFGLKIFSLLLAIMLELFFYSSDNSISATISASIAIRNLPQSMMIVWPPNAEGGLFAKFKVRGPVSNVKELELADNSIFVDLPVPTPSNYELMLTANHLRRLPGVKILGIEPASIKLKMEQVLRKNLLVVADQVGTVAAGYVVGEIKVVPETVFAVGPRSELFGLNAIKTAPIDLNGLKAKKSFELPLVGKGELTRLGVDVATVEVSVVPIEQERTINNVSVTVVAPKGFAASVEPSSVSVTLNGPVNLLDSIGGQPLKVVADGSQFNGGSHEVSLSGNFPPAVKLVRTDPKKVRIKLVSTHG